MTITSIDAVSEPQRDEETPTKRRPRRKGLEGSIRELASGRWQCRMPMRLGGASIGTFRTEAEATRALRRRITHVEDGTRARPHRRSPGTARRTVADVVADYLEDSKDRLAANTLTNYRGDLNRRIRPYPLGRISIEDLSTPDVAQWRAALSRDGFKSNSLRTAKALLQVAYACEAEMRGLPANPVAGLRRPPRTKRSTADRRGVAVRRAQIPTWDTLAKVLAAIPKRADRLFVLVLLWAGPRLGEAAALHHTTAVHPTRPALTIERVIVRGPDGCWIEEPPKNGESRDVPIPTAIWEALVAHRDTCPPGDSWKSLFAAWTRSGRFRGGPGVWTSRAWTDAVWGPAVVAADAQGLIVKRLRAHAATILVAAGATATHAQTLLGHLDLATTYGHYLVAEETINRDPGLASIRAEQGLSLEQRLERLWDLWIERHGDPLAGAV